jgi:hypothetical protein
MQFEATHDLSLLGAIFPKGDFAVPASMRTIVCLGWWASLAIYINLSTFII